MRPCHDAAAKADISIRLHDGLNLSLNKLLLKQIVCVEKNAPRPGGPRKRFVPSVCGTVI
jgi:hypothetical protein